MPAEQQPPQEGRRRSWELAMSVGWELASFTLLGFGLGYWIDGRWRTSPWGVLVSTLVGIVLGLYQVVRSVIRSSGGLQGRR